MPLKTWMSLSMKPRSRPALVVTIGSSFEVAAAILCSTTEERNGKPAPIARPLMAERRLIFAVLVSISMLLSKTCSRVRVLHPIILARRGSLRTHLDAFSWASLQLYYLAGRVLGFVTVAVYLQSSAQI